MRTFYTTHIVQYVCVLVFRLTQLIHENRIVAYLVPLCIGQFPQVSVWVAYRIGIPFSGMPFFGPLMFSPRVTVADAIQNQAVVALSRGQLHSLSQVLPPINLKS